MIFKAMKSDYLKKAIEGHTDILSKAQKEHEAFFKKLPCVSCGGEVMSIVNAKKPFKTGEIMPNFLAKCRACGCEFEPYTGIQLNIPR